MEMQTDTMAPPSTAVLPALVPAGPVLTDPGSVACRFKDCKKTPKFEEDQATLLACTIRTCPSQVHRACLARMLARFDGGSDCRSPVCGKRCFNAYVKQTRAAAAAEATPTATASTKKKRIRWDNDGPVASVSSLSCLLDWMTSGDNYKRYTGGVGQVGETKAAIASESLRFIAASGVTTARLAKDVISKIQALETSFKEANDWLKGTGVGVTCQTSLRQCILARCQYYYELKPIMECRASTNPILTNKDARFNTVALSQVSDDDVTYVSDDDDTDDAPPAPSCAQPSSSKQPSSTTTMTTERPSSQPRSIVQPLQRKKRGDPTTPHPAYLLLKEKQLGEDRDFKKMKLAYREQEMTLHREELRLKAVAVSENARESQLRQEETAERTKKHRYEAEHWRVQASVTLLRERAKLRNDGVPQDEIDFLLPLSSQLQ